MSKGEVTYAFGTKEKVRLWVKRGKDNEDGSFNFRVINGSWGGRYYPLIKKLIVIYPDYVDADGKRIPAKEFSQEDTHIVWFGICPYDTDGWQSYNDAIPWIEERIQDPKFVIGQFDIPNAFSAAHAIIDDEIYEENLKNYRKNNWLSNTWGNDDEIPF